MSDIEVGAGYVVEYWHDEDKAWYFWGTKAEFTLDCALKYLEGEREGTDKTLRLIHTVTVVTHIS